MMNKLKKSYAGLLTQTTQAMAGLERYAEGIGVVLVSRTAMSDKLASFIEGGNASTQQKAALSTGRAVLRSTAKPRMATSSWAR